MSNFMSNFMYLYECEIQMINNFVKMITFKNEELPCRCSWERIDMYVTEIPPEVIKMY